MRLTVRELCSLDLAPVSKEKENISKKKKIVDSHSCHANNVASYFDKNEIHVLKRGIDCLSSNLSNCVFNHDRLESMFRKKQISYAHAQAPRHTYALHAHSHTTHMHARVYKCTYCGRKGHLAKFYFDKINSLKFANNNVWVPFVSNPRRPKKKWVPKSPPLVFDVGVGSHMT